jgi:hypothetical protein
MAVLQQRVTVHKVAQPLGFWQKATSLAGLFVAISSIACQA